MGPRELRDADGRVIARLLLEDRGEWQQADVEWVSPDVPAAELAALLLRERPAARVATLDARLAEELVTLGGRVMRAGTQMEYDVRAHPPPADWSAACMPSGTTLSSYAADEGAAASRLAAYAPPHPDHDPRRATMTAELEDLRRLTSGTVTGPVIESASAVARTNDGVLGAILVCLMPANPLWSGPWITDLFVAPPARRTGLGSALVRHAVAAIARDGHPGIGLTVTKGNPARMLYERLGFVATHSFTSVELP